MINDSFFNKRLFIKLTWSLYFKQVPSQYQNEFITYQNELINLINTTNLNNQILIHSLYYLYLLISHKSSIFTSNSYPSSFHSISRVKLLSGDSRRTSIELKELIIVLLMLANKSHDDSSYTMKTWTNLTSVPLSILKKREIIILRKINYNVFLTNQNYNKWLDLLYSQCLKFELIIDQPSPKSLPILSNNSNIISNTYSSPLFQNSSSSFALYPLTPKSPLLDLSNSKRSYNDDNNEPLSIHKRQRTITAPSELLLTPLKYNNNNNNSNSGLLLPANPSSMNMGLNMPSIQQQQQQPHYLPLPPLQVQVPVQVPVQVQSFPIHHPLQNHQLQQQPFQPFQNQLQHQQHPRNCRCCNISFSNGFQYDFGPSVPVMMKSML